MRIDAVLVCVFCWLLHLSISAPICGKSKKQCKLRKQRDPSYSLTDVTIGFESQNFIFDKKERVTLKISHLNRNKNADFETLDRVSTDIYDKVHERSTCPWYYVKESKANRFPKIIYKAVSLSPFGRCIGSGDHAECLPINITFTGLLRRNGKWTDEEISTTVGFTCVGKRIASSVPKLDEPEHPEKAPEFA